MYRKKFKPKKGQRIFPTVKEVPPKVEDSQEKDEVDAKYVNSFIKRFSCTIVNPDMEWKPGELQSVYNELSFHVELASPCTNLLKFCLLMFQ